MSKDTLQRFSNRVDDYINFRPHYPEEMIAFLVGEGIVTAQSVVADIGSGTGISSELFLLNGNKVYGVEPNKEMREAAENIFLNNKNFISVAATAESTSLAVSSIDLIIASQAFHWFDKAKCKEEFRRILKKDASLALIWNDRRTDSSDFLIAYEKLLKDFGTDYSEVNHKNIDKKQMDDFFGEEVRTRCFDNFQHFEYEGLEGRLRSCSYVPSPEQAGYQPMMEALKELFKEFNTLGKITFEYDTRIFYGKLK